MQLGRPPQPVRLPVCLAFLFRPFALDAPGIFARWALNCAIWYITRRRRPSCCMVMTMMMMMTTQGVAGPLPLEKDQVVIDALQDPIDAQSRSTAVSHRVQPVAHPLEPCYLVARPAGMTAGECLPLAGRPFGVPHRFQPVYMQKLVTNIQVGPKLEVQRVHVRQNRCGRILLALRLVVVLAHFVTLAERLASSVWRLASSV
mmetsp:Transcript_10710/g.29756  ORF Transcript_10710/g.29756 Transcript_10710/m.29756 type:complete len:202 (-) Transcript_10710:1247-1852(-)